jgi:uncharacterized protein YdeI (YjbR/CyaY-like superfamily)
MPAELAAALAADPALKATFDALAPGYQRTSRRYVAQAVAPETRVRRAQQIVAGIAAGRRPGVLDSASSRRKRTKR